LLDKGWVLGLLAFQGVLTAGKIFLALKGIKAAILLKFNLLRAAFCLNNVIIVVTDYGQCNFT